MTNYKCVAVETDMGIDKNQILAKEISRKQFLQILAGAGFAVFGFSNFLSFVTTVTNPPQAKANDSGRHGFGSSKFGV